MTPGEAAFRAFETKLRSAGQTTDSELTRKWTEMHLTEKEAWENSAQAAINQFWLLWDQSHFLMEENV